MFSKAPIKRFNDEAGCAPPVTKYDPKFQTDLSASAKRLGGCFYKSDRFRESQEKDGPFLVPDRPPSASGRNLSRPGSSQPQSRKIHSSHLMMNKSISTQSLPVAFLEQERGNMIDSDTDSLEDYQVHRVVPSDLICQLSEKEQLLSEMTVDLSNTKMELDQEKTLTSTLEIKLKDTEEKLEMVTAASELDQKKTEDLQNMLNERDVQIQNVETKMTDSQQEIETLSKSLQAEQSKCGKLKDERNLQHSCMVDMEKKLKELRKELEVKLDEKDQLLERAVGNAEGLKLRYENKIEDLEKVQSSLDVQMATLQLKLKEKSKTMAEITADLDKTRMELEQEMVRASSLEIKLADKEEKLEMVTISSETWYRTSELDRNKIEDLQKMLNDKDVLIQNVETRMIESHQEIESLSMSLQAEQSKLSKLEDERNMQNACIVDMEKQLEEVRNQFDVKLKEKEGILSEMTSDLSKTKLELDQEKTLTSTLEVNLRDMEEKLEMVTVSSELEQKKTEYLQNLLNERDVIIQNVETKMIDSHQEIETLSKSLQVEQSKLSKLEDERNIQNACIVDMEKQLEEVRNQFDVKLKEKEGILSEMTSDLSKTKLELDQEKTLTSTLEVNLRDMEEKLEMVTASSELEQKQTEYLQNLLNERDVIIQNVETKMTNSQQEIESLSESLQAEQSKLSKLEDERNMQNACIVDMEKQLEEVRNQFDVKLKEKEGILSDTTVDFNKTKLELDQEKTLTSTLEIKLKDMEEKLEMATTASELDQKKTEDLQSLLNERDVQIQNVETKMIDNHQEIETLSKSLQEEQSKLSKLEDEWNLQNTCIVNLEKKLKEMRNAFDTQLEEKEGILSEMTSDLSKTKLELDQEKTLTSTLEVKLNDVEDKLEMTTTASELDRNKIGDLQNILIERDVLIQNIEAKMTNSQQEIESLSESLQAEQSKLSKLEDERNMQNACIVDMEKQLEEVRNEFDVKLKEKEGILSDVTVDLNKTKLELDQEKTLTSSLKTKLNDMEDKLEMATTVSELDRNKIEELQNLLNERDVQIQNVETKMIESHQEIESLSKSLQAEQSKLSKLEDERNTQNACIVDMEKQLKEVKNELDIKLEEKDQLLDVAVGNAEVWKLRYESKNEEYEKVQLNLDTHLSALQNIQKKLDESFQLKLQSSVQSVELSETQRKVEVLSNQLIWSEHQMTKANKKFDSIRGQIQSHIARTQQWETKSKLMEGKSQELAELIKVERQKSTEALVSKDAQIENLMKQNSSLESLVGPFKQQLKNYETELRHENESAAENAKFTKELADKYANLLGHQNQRQKIHHLQKLKEEITKLKQDVADKDKELKHARTVISDYETKNFGRRFDPRRAFRHELGVDDSQNRPN